MQSTPSRQLSLEFSTVRYCSVVGCTRLRHAKGYCGTHLSRMRRQGTLADPPSCEEQFWARVDKTSSPFGCHLWTGCVNQGSGYGILNFRGVATKAHRVAWTLQHGPIPPGLQVLHTCEAKYPRGDITCRRCVRHLKLGTAQDNCDDMVATGRWTHVSHPGEDSPRAILTWEQVREIRATYVPFKVSQQYLADKYGVSRWAVEDVVKHRNWREV